MMAFLKIAWAYRKWVAYGLAVLAMSILIWRVHAWREGYLARNAAVKALATEKQAHDADLLRIAQQQEQDAADRAKLQQDLSSIRERFAALQKQSPIVTIRTVEKPIAPGQTTCPEPRVSPDWRLHWNAVAAP